MKTVKELKEYLLSALSTLEKFKDEQELEISRTTYGMGDNFIATHDGFININNMVKDPNRY